MNKSEEENRHEKTLSIALAIVMWLSIMSTTAVAADVDKFTNEFFSSGKISGAAVPNVSYTDKNDGGGYTAAQTHIYYDVPDDIPALTAEYARSGEEEFIKKYGVTNLGIHIQMDAKFNDGEWTDSYTANAAWINSGFRSTWVDGKAFAPSSRSASACSFGF